MRHSGLLVSVLAVSCVAPTPDAGLSEAEQAEWDGGSDDPGSEVIVIEGEIGWPDWWFPGPGTPQDPGDTGDGYGSGGGGGGPGPSGPKKPPRKDCTAEEDDEACVQCCWYNYNDVDGYDCRKISDPIAREACWQSIFPAYVACLLYCKRRDPGILTGSLPGENAP